MRKVMLIILIVVFLSTISISTALTEEEQLGKLLYFDVNLSTPKGQACASCHAPETGFAGDATHVIVYEGVVPNKYGNRQSPAAAYASYSPDFSKTADGNYIGGQFWDGRAKDLVEQAKGPFLNPVEMHNPNKQAVITSIRNSHYANLFEKVTGINLKDLSSNNINLAYDKTAKAIAAYESSSEVNKFTSKYDAYLAGRINLTPEEHLGMDVFNDKCAQCHTSSGEKPVFTDYTYDNLGTPKNPANPFYYMPKPINPDGVNFVDYGLGGSLKSQSIAGWENELGKMKVPTLRNVAVSSPYLHNGVFTTLNEVVHFYNTRDIQEWPAPEVAQNVNYDEIGNLGLNQTEEKAIVSFLETLTDGYN